MSLLDNFFTYNSRLDVYVPGNSFDYFSDDLTPQDYEEFLYSVLSELFSVTQSFDWDYIYKVIRCVPGGVKETLEAYAKVIAAHELLHYGAFPNNLEGVSCKFGFEIILTKKGYRVNGKFKVLFSEGVPLELREQIGYEVAMAPSHVEGSILSVSDLKKFPKAKPMSSIPNFISRIKEIGLPIES